MKTDWSIMNMKVVYLLLVLAINSMDFQAFAQGKLKPSTGILPISEYYVM